MDPLLSPATSNFVSPNLLDILKETDDIDFTDDASVLFGLFDGTVQPDIFLTFANKVALQQIFIVKVCIPLIITQTCPFFLISTVTSNCTLLVILIDGWWWKDLEVITATRDFVCFTGTIADGYL